MSVHWSCPVWSHDPRAREKFTSVMGQNHFHAINCLWSGLLEAILDTVAACELISDKGFVTEPICFTGGITTQSLDTVVDACVQIMFQGCGIDHVLAP